MPQVAARQTSSNGPAVAGAMIWAYEKLLGRKPASKTSWLYPLALSALETASWKALWNHNVGNVTTSAAHDWYYNPHVTGDLKFAAFPTLGAGCLAEMHWLSAHGGLVAADAGDYEGFMNVLEKGCYAGCVPYPSLQGNITALQNIEPKRYWELLSSCNPGHRHRDPRRRRRRGVPDRSRAIQAAVWRPEEAASRSCREPYDGDPEPSLLPQEVGGG